MPDVVEYGRASLDLEAAINEELHGGRTASLPERLLIDGTSNYPKAQVVPLARLLDAYRSVRAREKQRDSSETR
jgi:aldehyde:ferredoxin oxidoreductase